MAYFASGFFRNTPVESTYTAHYKWPFRQENQFTWDDNKKPPIELPKKKQLKDKTKEMSPHHQTVGGRRKRKKVSFDIRKEEFSPNDSQWKIDGWRAAQNLWLRKLDERKEFARTRIGVLNLDDFEDECECAERNKRITGGEMNVCDCKPKCPNL